jgi:hypothetical protein
MLPASQGQAQPAHWQDPLSRPRTAPVRVPGQPATYSPQSEQVRRPHPPAAITLRARGRHQGKRTLLPFGAGAGCNRISALGARFWTFCESASLVRRCCSFRQVAGRGGLAVEALRVHVRAGSQAPRISGPRRRGLTGPRLARGKPALSVEPGTPGTWRQPSGHMPATAATGCHALPCLECPSCVFACMPWWAQRLGCVSRAR